MNTPMQVGITGGIGTGKSLICKVFACLGVPIYDADSRAKLLMTTDTILVDLIRKEFGNLSYHPDGSLNREHLREVFKEPLLLEKLNKLVHPRVGQDYLNWTLQHVGSQYVIKEAALLIESGSAEGLDKLIVVTAPLELRVKRVLIRDPHRTKNEIELIVSNQMSDVDKLERADFVITNDETKLVIPQVLELHERFMAMN
ncbi:MAG: dephospho-CoA kinase [Cyclobacteriaceae bacterium]